MDKKPKEAEVEKLINKLSYDETIDFMKWMIKEKQKEDSIEKTKPKHATTTDDSMMRRQLGMK